MLDKRTLKTPQGTQLALSQKQLPLALLIADEWENQTDVLKPHALPVVRARPRTHKVGTDG